MHTSKHSMWRGILKNFGFYVEVNKAQDSQPACFPLDSDGLWWPLDRRQPAPSVTILGPPVHPAM